MQMLIASSVIGMSWVDYCRWIQVAFFLLLSAKGLSQQTHVQIPLGYQTNLWVYTPPSYSPSGAGSPVLISLHGGSGIVDNNDYNVIVDNSLNADKVHLTPGRLIWQGLWDSSLPFIVVSPHLKRDFSIANVNEQTWPTDLLDEVVEFVKSQYNVDDSRIYFTGISVGATGTWDYAKDYPEKVAAIMPMGGKGAKGDACLLKDIPIWTFHGQDDGLVPNRFSIEMVQAIQDCSPAGKYVPHLTLNNSLDHVVWNSLFNDRSYYHIYSWLTKFVKGDDSNKAPFVFTGVDRTIVVRPGPIYLSSEYFDSDGQVASVQWAQMNNPGIDLGLADTDAKFLRINNPQVGTFVFRLTVTDNDGISSFEEIQITFVASHPRTLTGLTLYKQEGTTSTLLGTLADDQVWDMSVIGTRINIQATASVTSPVTNRVRWSINSDQHTRDTGPLTGTYYLKDVTSNVNTSGWGVVKGTYLVCATPYSSSTLANEGASLCYRITFSDEFGIQKFYASSSADLSNLSSWHSNPDGTGETPVSFGADNQWFIVESTATIGSSGLTVSGNKSRFIVATTGSVTVNGILNAPVYVEGIGSISISGSGSVVTYTNLSRTSRVTYNGGAMTIPGNNTTFGHLTISGAGVKAHAGGITFVKGNLTIGTGADMRNVSLNGNSQFQVSGNVTIATASTMPYTLRFMESYGNQYLTLPGDHAFRAMSVEGGCTASIIAPGTSTLTIGSGTGGGQLDIHTYSLLKLNGHNVTLINNAGLNVNSSTGQVRTGKIELTGSRITVNPTTPAAAFNLYPVRGKNHLKFLDITVPLSHEGFNILDSLSITEGVKITNGKINSNGNLSLLSTPLSTAYVAPAVGTGTIVGNVNVERMVKPGKVYRYLSFPVKDFNVDKLQKFIPVSGAFDGASQGYSTSPSLYVFHDPSYSWIPYPSASQDSTASLELGKGYAVYVRETAEHKKMVLTGELQIGSFNYSSLLTNNPAQIDTLGWNLLGNPYAAPILWGAPGGWGLTNIDQTVYIRDNNTNGFRVWDGSTGDIAGGIIPIGQSFYVRASNGSPGLIVNEAAKQPLISPELYRAERSDVMSLVVSLKQNSQEDKVYLKFSNDGNNEWLTGRDAVKKKNDYFNISVLSSDDHSLAIKNLCDTLCSQRITLLVQPNGIGNYSMVIGGNAFDEIVDKVYIVDEFSNKTLDWKMDSEYVFEVTDDPGSYSMSRFHLILEKASAEIPVIKLEEGYLVSSVIRDVQWMLNGVDIEGATGPTLLPLVDGDYAVRTIGKSCSKTSAIFSYRVTEINEENGTKIHIYPNPARNYLKISGLKRATSKSQYNIISINGSAVQSGNFDVSESGEGEIRLKSTAPGFYILQVADDKIRQVKFSIQP
jgi:predicted esterase